MRADFQVMKDISQFTRVVPTKRGEELLRFTQQLQQNKEVIEELSHWNLSIQPHMLEVQGRVLPQEVVIFRDNVRYPIDPSTGEWSSLTKNNVLVESVAVKHWLLVYPPKNARQAGELADSLFKVGTPLGIMLTKPVFVQLPDDKNNSYMEAIKANLQPTVQCVVCILPTPKKDRYDQIKRLCSLELPVPSQCVVAKSLTKPNTFLSVCNKIMQQINCKLGGQLWVMDIPLARTMLVGIDVCHDTSSRNAKQSVAGFCASMNATFTKVSDSFPLTKRRSTKQNAETK